MKRVILAASFSLPLLALACGDKVVTGSAPPPNRAAPVAAADAGLPAMVKAPEYSENDFVESDRNRDPFRSYLSLGGPQGPRPLVNQREVKLAEYSIDELKLMAIVLGGDQSRAMFVDPSGKGTVVYRGNFICRPEVVHLGGSNGPEYQLNWRVDRIREGDIVLIREDPAQPAIPPATRVIPLHPENEDKDKEARSG
jgi:type IV pilus assembly protein PilP